ncbi:MAG: NAD(P)/FAD-dependent oxidoreductase [Anaerolineae bacterium]
MKLDVAIIGASSAGLYAAEQLARAGRRVGVFEQHAELDPACRTLIVTPQLQRLLGYVPDAVVLHRIQVMAMATPGVSVRVELQDPDLIVERCRLAHLLAGRAQKAGAELCYGYRFQGLEPHPGGVALHLRAAGGQAATVVAQTVIGADGLFSEVAAAANIKHPPVVPILQVKVRLPPGWDPAVTQVWFDADETRFFYWLIPESVEKGVVGMVGDDRAETWSLLQSFLDRHGFQPLAYQGAQVAMHHPQLRPWERVGSAPVLLVGDAAGQVKVTTVGGTVSGLWGAAAAVRALLRGTPYAHELRPLKRELDLHWFIRLLLDRLDNPGYDRLVSSVTPAVQQFLSRRNRDEMAGAFWKLLLLQPRLLVLGLRLLLHRSGRRRLSPEAIDARFGKAKQVQRYRSEPRAISHKPSATRNARLR